MTDVTTITVDGSAPHDVLVGNRLASFVPGLVQGATSVLVIADEQVKERADVVRQALADSGLRADIHVLPSGEQAKSLSVAASLWDELGRRRLTRNDAVVAVGGGATTDVVGFAAATWLRGIRVVHVPTTLLAMVDAAIGGKTGINTEAGKNLVGSFHPPAGVLVDLGVLATLPPAQWVNGLAEVVKAGFIRDPRILDLIELNPAPSIDPRSDVARELVEKSIQMKASVVSEDLR